MNATTQCNGQQHIASRDKDLLPAVLGLWQDILPAGSAALQADTHFFLAGGDSLHLARLLQRIRQHFGLTLHLHEAALFSTPEKMSALCQRRLAERKVVRPPAGLVSCRSERYPASGMQQGLWFETQFAGSSGLYNAAVALHLTGRLDVQRLQHALNLLIMQHPVLRSRFILSAGKGGLEVSIAPVTGLVLPLTPLVAGQLDEVLAGAASLPFDLAQQDPYRLHLYRLDSNEHVLLVCLHHCVTDGWSGNVLLHNLASIWNALCDEPGWTPPAIDIGQAAYCHAEARGWQQGAHLEALAWWQRQAVEINLCDDWLAHVACTGRPFRLATESLLLRTASLQREEHSAASGAVTSCTRLLTAFRLALLELTGSANCLIGMPVSCRQGVPSGETNLEQSAGCFVNLVLSHDCVSQAEPPHRLLQRLHRRHLRILSHAGVPFAEVAKAIGLNPRASGNTGFDILFAFQNSPARMVAFSGLAHTVRQIPPQYGQFPLALSVSAATGGYQCTLDYAADICSSAWARRLLGTCQKKYRWLCE